MRIIINLKEKYYYEVTDNDIIDNSNFLSENNNVSNFFKESVYLSIFLDSALCIFENISIQHYKTIKTDGHWVWSSDIEHYVEKHNLKLPELFLNHINSLKNLKINLSQKKERILLSSILNINGEYNVDNFTKLDFR